MSFSIESIGLYFLTQIIFLLGCVAVIFYVVYFHRNIDATPSSPSLSPSLPPSFTSDLNVIYGGIALGITVNILFSFIPNLSNELFFLLSSGGGAVYLFSKSKIVDSDNEVYKIISSFNLNTVFIGLIIGYFFIEIFEKLIDFITKELRLPFLKNIFLRAVFASLFCLLHSFIGVWLGFTVLDTLFSNYNLLIFLYTGLSGFSFLSSLFLVFIV